MSARTFARGRALAAVGIVIAAGAVVLGRGLVPAGAAAATDTAWHNGSFNLDRPNVVRRSNIVLGSANTIPQQSLPLGNGSLGVAEWAAGGFTAQLNRSDTLPDRHSPGQVTIPGLSRITGAADFAAHLDLYDGVLTESGAGMTAQIYVRADSDELVVDVTGADPNSAQTAQVGLWSGRSPAATASGAIGTLAETWTDNQTGGTHATYGSLAAMTAGGRNVAASAVDSRTVRVSFNPNSDGSFRVLVGAPAWTGGDAVGIASALLGSSATTPSATLQAAHLAWWHDFWSGTNLMKLTSTDGSGEYLENLRTFYLYQEAGLNRGTGNVPGTQAGVADMYSFNQDNHDWIPADVWWWNVRMQVTANMTSGATALNTRFVNFYESNLANIQAWTASHVPGSSGACVPETMRFNGNGYYGGDLGNSSCDTTIAPSWNSQTLSTGAEVSLAIWQQYLMTGDTAFLSAGYPLMKASAQFLLSYATTGSDGLLHTISNAHETQWHVHDPITDVLAMKALFPAVQQAAQTLNTDASFVTQLGTAIAKLRDLPRTDAASRSQVLTASADAGGQDVLALSAEPTAVQHNTENLDLEATYPYGLIGDASGTLTDLEKRTYTSRMFRNNADWSYDALQAARLGLAGEVQADLVASTERFQLLPSGMANLFGSGTSNEPYNEQAGIVAATLNEALAQDYDGLLRAAPAWPSTWDVDGTVSAQHNSRLDVQVRNGVPSTVVLEAGANAAMQVRSPWPGQSVQVVDASTGAVVLGPTTSSPFTINTSSGHAYLIEQAAQPFTNLPYAQVTGAPATAAKHLGPVSIGLGGATAEGPYGGTPAAVPGVVQAENYDTGGQGVGYSVNPVNGNANGYRTDGVDLESTSDTGGGYDVGWTVGGQWFRYAVNVATAGTYTVGLRVAAPGTVTGALHLANSSGANLSGSVGIPATGGWQTWATVTVHLTLPAGRQVLTLVEDNGGWNINSLTFASSGGTGGGPFGGTPAGVPGVVQVENYDTGGQGVGYSVSSVNGTANGYRTDGVDLESTSDTGGGYNVGWTAGGQWFRYTLNVASAGTYTVGFRVAAPSAVTGAFHVANSSGTNLSGNVNVAATGGWQTWATVTASVALPAGQQVLTLAEDNGGWNINSMQLTGGGGTAVNLAAGKPTSESSHVQAYASGDATDADQNTYWESANNAFPQWIQVDLVSAQNASRVVLQLPASWGARDQTLSLLASLDGTTFTTIKASAAYTFSPSNGNTVTVTFPATAQRYWRVNVAANTGWPAGQISELQIWSQ